MQKRNLHALGKIIAVFLGLAAVVEISVRVSGLVDFPIYRVDSAIGYLAMPNQAGQFLRKNDWAFNDKSMATTTPWTPNLRPNILLIGNSVVMGGNPYEQKDKLGNLVGIDVGARYSVWPIAAGGWSSVNEVAYLQREPDVVSKANFFVWEYMAGGLSALSGWRGDYVFPTRRPVCASCYAFRRYVLPRLMSLPTNELPPKGPLAVEHLAEFERSVDQLSRVVGSRHPGIIFLYPDKQQTLMAKGSEEWLPERRSIQAVCARHGLILVDIAADPRWTTSLYRDGTHPTVQGNDVLAHILTAAIIEANASNESPPKVAVGAAT